MRYASLPRTSNLEQAQVRRSTRDLRGFIAHVERILSDRSFRMWALLTLNLLDVLTTAVVLSLGGTESNPAMQGIVEQWWGPIVVKGVVLAAMWTAVLRAPLRSRLTEIGLAAAWMFYGGVVVWNTVLLINH